MYCLNLLRSETSALQAQLVDARVATCLAQGHKRWNILTHERSALNHTERKIETVLHVNDVILQLRFGKYEVKTVLYENKELSELSELII